MQLNYTVPWSENGWKLQDILLSRLHLSQTIIKKLKAKQLLNVNHAPAFTNYLVQAGDNICVSLDFEEPNPDIIPINGELDILFEDEALLIVNKPSGMNVHPSRANFTGSLSNIVAYYYQIKKIKASIHSVNRLDRDTMGIVVFAKNAYIKDRLIQSMQRGEFEKKYLGWVFGKMPQESGTIDAPIRREQEGSMIRILASDGDRAVTRFRTQITQQFRCSAIKSSDLIAPDSPAAHPQFRTEIARQFPHEIDEEAYFLAQQGLISLIEFTLETGRTHQIRVHCLSVGCPLLGDKLYYTEESAEISNRLRIDGQALCAHQLQFPHPLSGRLVDIELKGAVT